MCVCVCLSADMSPSFSAHDQWLIMKRSFHMPDGAIHYTLYLLNLFMAVDNVVFRIIKGAF